MELPQHLVNEIVKYTNSPWWNGRAYAGYMGYPQKIRKYENGIGDAVDEINDVIEWMRNEKLYAQADRLRTIAGRLARLRPASEAEEATQQIRSIARGWK